MYIKINDKYYYAGKNENIKIKNGIPGSSWGEGYGKHPSLPMFTKEKTKAEKIKSSIDLKRIFSELVDAIRFKDVFENEEVKEIKVYKEG